jgi:hypothetical protein
MPMTKASGHRALRGQISHPTSHLTLSRPLRIDFPEAVCHVTSRGGRRECTPEDDDDRIALLTIVEQGLGRFDAQIPAYCLMGTHDPFVLHTRFANLSLQMRHIHAVYGQRCNRRSGRVGHLLQVCFKAMLVDREPTLWRCAAPSNKRSDAHRTSRAARQLPCALANNDPYGDLAGRQRSCGSAAFSRLNTSERILTVDHGDCHLNAPRSHPVSSQFCAKRTDSELIVSP